MDGTSVGLVIIPGGVALVFLLVLSYLQTSVRDPLVRLWQAAWATYFGHTVALFLFLTYGWPGALTLSQAFLVLTGLSLLASSRAVFHEFRPHWVDGVLLCTGLAWALLSYVHPAGKAPPRLDIEVGIAALLVFAAGRFYRSGKIRESLGLQMLAAALCLWAVLLSVQQFQEVLPRWLASVGEFAGPLPRLLLGVSMVMVLFENERRTMQDNTLAFSTLDIDASKLLSHEDLIPALEKMLIRVLRLIKRHHGMLCAAEQWRGILPSVQVGFGDELLKKLEQRQVIETLAEVAYRRGGIATFRDVPSISDPIVVRGVEMSEQLRTVLGESGIVSLTAVSLQTRNSKVGVLIFPHEGHRGFSTGMLRLLLATAMQIGTTLENYILMHQAHRRTQEYELLTQIGQVVSSHLDPDEVLRAIHNELGKLFDTETFYIAFENDGQLDFEFEVREGEVQPKRSRKMTTGLTEYIIRTGQPLLVRSEFDKFRKRMGIEHNGKMAKSFAGVPIRMGAKTAGVMGALHTDREFVYEQRDLELLQTAAGQVAVAVENARLFAGEQKRSRYLEFLNNISKTAISSQDADQMLAEIVASIERNFRFDHIGVGLLDYATKEIEIKAEGGPVSGYRGRRVPLGAGILGRVARTGEMAVLQGEVPIQSLVPDSRSLVCMPLTYGEMLLGVLNVESKTEKAFSDQEVLLLRTVADLLATALHNAFVFQKMQQQSITDGLTGIKTRRFFMEAVQSEWKRASRSGRPFSVVLIDLDKFKEVNDSMGHLEGDLVLARVGRLLEQKSRQSNVVARYGGDEFVILMPETGADQAHALSERLRLWIATDTMLAERKVTGSFGVATFPVHGTTVEELIRIADDAMYVAKHEGGNRVSAAVEDGAAEATMVHNQQLLAYVEGFLQREESGPEYADELVSTLKRLCTEPQGAEDTAALLNAIKTLNRAAEAREEGALGHGEQVARYAGVIGRELGLDAEQMRELTLAASVHDVGKILAPEKVLNKPGFLSEREFSLLRMHSDVGSRIVGVLPGSTRLQQFVRHHHERFDGQGYPDGLKGEAIPLAARIIALADAYVNLVTERAFSPRKTEPEAMRELEAQSGIQLDGMLVRILAAHLRGERVARTSG